MRDRRVGDGQASSAVEDGRRKRVGVSLVSASVLMEAAEAARRGLRPLGVYRGIAVAGCEPDEMGAEPVYAVPKLLNAHDLSIDDIGLWSSMRRSRDRRCIAVTGSESIPT